jgi:RNA polymerase sigma factor (sigma-70 family)
MAATGPATSGSGDLLGDDGWFVDLYPYLHRVAAVAAPADVDPDDLVQDALTGLLQRSLDQQVESPKAYLSQAIVHLASNRRRSWSRQRHAMERMGRADDPVPTAYPSDLDDLDVLSPTDRAVLYLHHVEGHRFDVVAELVGSSPAAVRKRAERARRSLMGHLRGELDGHH